MRVAFFVPDFPVVSQTFIVRQIDGLLDRGHDVRVFADRRPRPGEPVHDAVTDRQLLRRTMYLDGEVPGRLASALSLVRCLASSKSRRCLGSEAAAAFGGYRSLIARLRALRGAAAFDVVHCHFGPVALKYRLAARLWDAPLVASFYGFDCSRYPRIHGEDVYAPLFAEADAVTVLSEHMRGRLIELRCPPALLRCVPLGVDLAAFTPNDAPPADADGAGQGAGEAPSDGPGPRTDRSRRPVRLLSVARLVEKKGLEYAIEAVARIVGRGRDVRYEILGDGPLRASLETRARSLGIADRVGFAGAVDQREVRAAMARADLFLLPSVTAADGDQEGTPTVLIEAAACGLPVLSTRHAGIPEIVLDGESGYLVPERDVDALAARLTLLLDSPERRERMGRRGRAHVERRFGHERVAALLETLYSELLRGASRRSKTRTGRRAAELASSARA